MERIAANVCFWVRYGPRNFIDEVANDASDRRQIGLHRIGSVKENAEFSRGTILEAVEQDEDL